MMYIFSMGVTWSAIFADIALC